MQKIIFINLPVQNIATATRFYEALGCVRNAQFSDHQTASMTWSDTITFHLLHHTYFSTFTAKRIANAHSDCEVLLAISCDSRQHVDATAEATAAAGGKADIRAPMDLGFMYNRAVEDPDGHVLELVWMDLSAMPAATAEPT